MPMSDVIEQARQAKLKKRREELKKISLLHTIFIANLRVRFPNHPTTNAPWANDEELVDYSLKDATESELSYLQLHDPLSKQIQTKTVWLRPF